MMLCRVQSLRTWMAAACGWAAPGYRSRCDRVSFLDHGRSARLPCAAVSEGERADGASRTVRSPSACGSSPKRRPTSGVSGKIRLGRPEGLALRQRESEYSLRLERWLAIGKAGGDDGCGVRSGAGGGAAETAPLRLRPCGSLDEADDLVQAACERALARRDQYEPGTRLVSWMYRIVQTIWIDQIRRQRTVSVDPAMLAEYPAAMQWRGGIPAGACGGSPGDRHPLARATGRSCSWCRLRASRIEKRLRSWACPSARS